jgi:hypothetical protein
MSLEWNFDNQEIINLKRREMIFEIYSTLGLNGRKHVHRFNQRK